MTRRGGITLDDCELVNRAWVTLWMNRISFLMPIFWKSVPQDLGRQLKKIGFQEESIDEEVDVKFYKAVKYKSKEMVKGDVC